MTLVCDHAICVSARSSRGTSRPDELWRSGRGFCGLGSSLRLADGLGIKPSGACSDCQVLAALVPERECLSEGTAVCIR